MSTSKCQKRLPSPSVLSHRQIRTKIPLPDCGRSRSPKYWSRVPLKKILASNYFSPRIVIGLYGLNARGGLTLSTALSHLSHSSATDNFDPRCSPNRKLETHQNTLRSRFLSLYLAFPRGRALPADFTAAVTPARVAPCALDQEGPAPPEDSASSDFPVTTFLAIPGGRASPSPTGFAAVEATAQALYCAHSGGQASPTDFAAVVAAALIVHVAARYTRLVSRPDFQVRTPSPSSSRKNEKFPRASGD